MTHLRLIQGGLADRPGYADSLPSRVYLEYPATLSVEVDTTTGKAIGCHLDAMPDRVSVFDKETWHELPDTSPEVALLLSSFSPTDELHGAGSIRWLHHDPEDPPA